MTDQDPNLDARVIRFYNRHNRRRRWQRWSRHAAMLGTTFCGLLIAVAVTYAGWTAYQDHLRLATLLEQQRPPVRQVQSIDAVTQLSAAPVPATNMTWAPGTWEIEAEQFLRAHAYDAVSSATPPQRHSRQRP